jgi:acetylornithine deacetylase/succinyl-diaminopimelate desuccinylase-like protein
MKERLVETLRELLTINTSNPPGGEEKAASFLYGLLKPHIPDIEIIASADGRANLFAKIGGKREARPIVLLVHLDTVPADEKEWSFPPFSAHVSEGFIYGRGAIDMKSQVVCTAFSLLELVEEGVVPENPIVFLATADEECGGKFGLCYVLEKKEELKSAAFVLSEGGFVIEEDGLLYAQIALSEKKLSQFVVKAKGTPGHASAPHGDNPNEKIVAAARRILSYNSPLRVTALARSYLNGILKGSRVGSYTFRDLREAVRDRRFVRFLVKRPDLNALLRNTIALTILRGGEKINVIPSLSEAYFDARLLPDQSHEAFFKKIRRLAGPEVEIAFTEGGISTPIPSPKRTVFFRLLKEVIQERLDCKVLPYMTAGATDLRFFRSLSIPSYGFFPLVLSKGEAQRMHGVDERVSIERLLLAFDIQKEIIRRLMLTRV